jgi:hypothetical protein
MAFLHSRVVFSDYTCYLSGQNSKRNVFQINSLGTSFRISQKHTECHVEPDKIQCDRISVQNKATADFEWLLVIVHTIDCRRIGLIITFQKKTVCTADNGSAGIYPAFVICEKHTPGAVCLLGTVGNMEYG